MKRILVRICAVLALLTAQMSLANYGPFFNVAATGTPETIEITLCLDGNGPLSCQTYAVNGLDLSITTAVLGHIYPDVGIIINTPGYSIANLGVDCTMISNGYCLFSGNSAIPKTITVIPTNNSHSPFLTLVGSDLNSGYPLIISSNNGGNSFANVTVPGLPSSSSFYATSCTGGGSSTICTAVGQNGSGLSDSPLLAATTDGGSAWAIKTITGLPSRGTFYASSCTGNGSTAICIAAGDSIGGNDIALLASSTDGGNTWAENTVTGLSTSSVFYGASCTGSGSTAVCAAAGEVTSGNFPPLVAVSTDGSNTWTTKTVAGLPIEGVLLSASCTGSGSSAICIAAGQDETGGQPPLLAVSTDGGNTWAVQSVPGNPSSGAYEGSSCTGSGSSAVCVAVGQDGTGSQPPLLVVSTDGGNTWAIKSISGIPSSMAEFSSVSCTGNGSSAICTAAGEELAGSQTPFLVVSSDGGNTWTLKTVTGLTLSGQFNGTSCIGGGSTAICTAVGEDYTGTQPPLLAISTDSGNTWATKTFSGLTTFGVLNSSSGTAVTG